MKFTATYEIREDELDTFVGQRTAEIEADSKWKAWDIAHCRTQRGHPFVYETLLKVENVSAPDDAA